MQNVIEVRHYGSRAGKNVFDDWLTQLADARAQAKIASRINRLAAGNFGDYKTLRQALSELWIDWGQGYRVYYAMMKHDRCAFAWGTGDRSSILSKDIRHA